MPESLAPRAIVALHCSRHHSAFLYHLIRIYMHHYLNYLSHGPICTIPWHSNYPGLRFNLVLLRRHNWYDKPSQSAAKLMAPRAPATRCDVLQMRYKPPRASTAIRRSYFRAAFGYTSTAHRSTEVRKVLKKEVIGTRRYDKLKQVLVRECERWRLKFGVDMCICLGGDTARQREGALGSE